MSDLYSEYKTKIFVDSNVILEAKGLKDLPWSDVDQTGPILVLLVPTVLREVDSKKRDGRLGVRAREFNRQLAPLVDGASILNVTSTPVRVDLALASCGRVDWEKLGDLDPTQGDDRLVAECLHAIGDFDERVLASQDMNPLVVAKRHGIKPVRLPDGWLPKPDASPQEKKVMQLQNRIRELEKTEPEFKVSFTVRPDPVNPVQIAPLTEADEESFIRKIVEWNPEPVQETGFMRVDYDSSLSRRYEKYKEITVPAYVRTYARSMEILLGQARFKLLIRSSGSVPAQSVKIDLTIVGGWFNEKPIIVPYRGPSAPTKQSSLLLGHHPPYQVEGLSIRVGKHEFDVDEPARDDAFSASCEDFRHGDTWEYEGALWIDPRFTGEPLVVVKVTAANLHGHKVMRFPLTTSVRHASFPELIDLESGELLWDAPVVDELRRAVDEEGVDVAWRYFEYLGE